MAAVAAEAGEGAREPLAAARPPSVVRRLTCSVSCLLRGSVYGAQRTFQATCPIGTDRCPDGFSLRLPQHRQKLGGPRHLIRRHLELYVDLHGCRRAALH